MPQFGMDKMNADFAEALIGIDTLWGGDVMNPSGTGRFIADCWFSDEPLPRAYAHPAASALRANGGVGARTPDTRSIDAYLAVVDVKGAIDRVVAAARAEGGRRDGYLAGLGECCEVMWDLAMELLGRGPTVPYDRCVRTLTGRAPEPSQPAEKRRRVTELLAHAGYPSNGGDRLLAAVDAWRADRRVPRKSILRPIVESGRAADGLRLAPAEMRGVRMLMKAMKDREVVGILPDQVPSRGEGVWAPFFGRWAYTMTLPARVSFRAHST